MSAEIVIRPLDPVADLAAVTSLFHEAADFWRLTERRGPDAAMIAEFFTSCPPGSDPARTVRLGLFQDDSLLGAAELSFDWPAPMDAFLGLMLFAPKARGHGLGPRLLANIEAIARKARAPALYLGVLAENPRARAFWERMGFAATGFSRAIPETRHLIYRLKKPL